MKRLCCLLFAVACASQSGAEEIVVAAPMAQALPDTLDARVTVSLDPVTRRLQRRVEIGVGANVQADYVAIWAHTGGQVHALDGAQNVTLPWRNDPTKVNSTVPGTSNDVELLAAVRVASAGSAVTYSGSEYFAFSSDPRHWHRVRIVLTKVVDVRPLNTVDTVIAALEAQWDAEAALANVGFAAAQGSQPRFGSSEGIRVRFAKDGNGVVRVKVRNVRVQGPVHNWEPAHVWLWSRPTNWGGCANPPLLKPSEAFYDYTDPTYPTLPVPYDVDPTDFDANRMIVTAGSHIRIIGIIEEKATGGTTLQYRAHEGEDLTVPNNLTNNSQSPEVLYMLNMCPTANVPRPQG